MTSSCSLGCSGSIPSSTVTCSTESFGGNEVYVTATTLQPYYLQNAKRIPGDCLEVDMENSESEYVQDGYSSVDITVVVLGRNHKLFHGVF